MTTTKIRTTAVAGLLAAAFTMLLPIAASAQIPVEPPIPCPWWDCGGRGEVVVEDYRVEVDIEDGIATTSVRQVLRNDAAGPAEGEFLHPISIDAAVTGLTLWIDGEPVSGEVLDGDAARRTYEEIVRRTLDPALLEFADDGLLRLSVFPIPGKETRTVEIEYRQVLPFDNGLFTFRHPMGREHNADVEQVSARIEINSSSGVKSVYSPSHSISVDRPNPGRAVVGYEASGATESAFTLYFGTDAAAVSLDVVSFRDGDDGYFVLLASPGLDDDAKVIPKDVIVVLDVSGSMEGDKIDQARDAARFILDNLNEGDRFEVISFSTGTDAYGEGLRPRSDAADARSWVAGLSAGGSTNIDLALSEALELAGSGRPGYVIFLTDGLPTEGIIDTSDILDNAADRASDNASVFAFGVGFDVDTFLLDSLARQHHGTATYVSPGEDIDTAVESLYSKVSSPVLTGVSVAVDGVEVSDIHPSPVPDVFRGGQLVVTGRYEGWGEAEITLAGRVRGERVQLRFDEEFRRNGGDPAIPRLWASRKIGDLLRQLRIDGPDEETIDQIVKLSIRWGIVTPYTSFLVTEDAPFGEDAIEEISRDAARSAATTIAPTSGSEAFAAADTAAELLESEVSAAPDGDYANLVRVAGDRTFRLTDGLWIDTTYDPDMDLYRVAFGSDDYFALAGSDPALAAALSVSPWVIVTANGVAFQVVPADQAGDTLPPVPETSTTQGQETVPSVLGAASGSSGGGGSAPVAVVAIGASLLAALMLAASGVRKH